ncbi:MAG: endonuclease/exonuclease/phosphatase family protein [Bacteroidales bacterium]|jgi:endonuclease/exonuclease/phosphatase family metal-dependent hydrolase|nr:endonuclease/exonuclease/phosphatase family protein [Bacteroidales bacterium]
MKRIIILIVCVLALGYANAQEICLGTYNIRNENNYDVKNGNGWKQRCPVICNMMKFENVDIFGSQEVLVGQLNDMLADLKDYSYIGVGRDDGREKGEYSPIIYKTSKFELLKHGNFWLSETPDVAGSKGWDAACIRICTWGHFQIKSSGRRFWYFNLHMDHKGVKARRESAKLVVKKIKEITNGEPVILTGDFNVDQNNEIYTIFTKSGILRDSYIIAKQRFAENGTFNGFDPARKTDSRIDHIFVSDKIFVNHYGILTNCYWTPILENFKAEKGKDAPNEIDLYKYQSRTPSDHYPVLIKFSFN